MVTFVTRFAPSPTGYLHIGHAFSALSAWRASQAAAGEFILRIEDLDETRCKPVYEAAICDDLNWLGLDWPKPVRRQSEHFAEYREALQRLIERDLVYRCFKTRKEIAEEISRAPHLGANGPEGPQYFGNQLSQQEEAALLEKGAPFAWRLSMQTARDWLGPKFDDLSYILEELDTPHKSTIMTAQPDIFGDVVLGRKDVGVSYHLASVYDDALQGVTHVIRGDDLAAAAHLHVLLQALLGLPTPVYRHHRLITDDSGKKFSKRDRAATIKSLRENGVAPADLEKLFVS